MKILRLWKRLIGLNAEAPDDSWQETQDRLEALCKGIMLQELPGPIAAPSKHPFGTPSRIRIARDPDEVELLLAPKREHVCVICGKTTTEKDRVPASVQYDLPEKIQYLESVWVHEKCLDQCAMTDEQRGVPS